MATMYQAKINSPSTTLAVGIDAIITSISVVDSSVLPPAPNLLTIGSGEDAETCRYTNITGNTVTVERGFQGVAKSWDLGVVVGRNYTAYDHDTFIANITASLFPTGFIAMFGGSTPPSGALICNGSAISRATYANLFAVIGTTYGEGDSSTTFNLPNFTDKFARGNVIGVGGGSDTHSHSFDVTGATTDTVLDHLHTVDPPITQSGVNDSGGVGGGIGSAAAKNTHRHNVDIPEFDSGSAGSHSHTLNTYNDTTENGNNVPAYTGVNFIIWY